MKVSVQVYTLATLSTNIKALCVHYVRQKLEWTQWQAEYWLTVKTQLDATVYQNFIIPYFKRSSTYFGQHTAHHQEPKTALAASSFAYVGGCQTCSRWTLSGSVYTLPDNIHQLHVQQPSTYAKPEAANAVLGSWWWAVCRLKHVELHINMK
jgi:hypothetical protein